MPIWPVHFASVSHLFFYDFEGEGELNQKTGFVFFSNRFYFSFSFFTHLVLLHVHWLCFMHPWILYSRSSVSNHFRDIFKFFKKNQYLYIFYKKDLFGKCVKNYMHGQTVGQTFASRRRKWFSPTTPKILGVLDDSLFYSRRYINGFLSQPRILKNITFWEI